MWLMVSALGRAAISAPLAPHPSGASLPCFHPHVSVLPNAPGYNETLHFSNVPVLSLPLDMNSFDLEELPFLCGWGSV